MHKGLLSSKLGLVLVVMLLGALAVSSCTPPPAAPAPAAPQPTSASQPAAPAALNPTRRRAHRREKAADRLSIGNMRVEE